MFSFEKQYQKISILPLQKGLEFPAGEGWGFFKTQKFKKMYEVLLELPEGWGRGGGIEKLPSVGEVWISH